jgi:hypothetical protein
MKALLATLALTACMSPATGIPGDTSPDDPGLPPDETGNGKSDTPPKKVVRGTGVVMGSPTVVHVYWGAYWLTDAGTADRAAIDAFTGMVGGSSWWQITSEYADASGTLPGAPTQRAPAFASDSEPPPQLYSTDTGLHEFLTAQLQSGNLSYDAETLYVVLPAPGTLPPRGECGHHSYYSATLDGHRKKVIYALVPYLRGDADASCGGGASANGASVDEITVTLSHEVAEAVTDPYLDAWGKGTSNEIADQCDNGFVASWGGAQLAVQQLWSNHAFACISDPPQ